MRKIEYRYKPSLGAHAYRRKPTLALALAIIIVGSSLALTAGLLVLMWLRVK